MTLLSFNYFRFRVQFLWFFFVHVELLEDYSYNIANTYRERYWSPVRRQRQSTWRIPPTLWNTSSVSTTKKQTQYSMFIWTQYISSTHMDIGGTVKGSSTRVFAITRLPSLLPPLHCLSLRSCCRHVTFPSLKKRSSVMTWFLSEYKKGDTVKFSTWSFLWAVYTAFGLSVDPLTRAFKCKHRWWMAMLIKWAELVLFIRFIKVFVLYKTFKRMKCRRDCGFVYGRG